jgi:hypothetical protein
MLEDDAETVDRSDEGTRMSLSSAYTVGEVGPALYMYGGSAA